MRVGREVEGRLTWEEVSAEALDDAPEHNWGDLGALKEGSETSEGSFNDGAALRTVKDVIICFVELLASCASVVNSVSLILGASAHLFVGGPLLERKFCGGFTTFASGAIEGSFDRVPVDGVEGVNVPVFIRLEIVAEVFVIAFVK